MPPYPPLLHRRDLSVRAHTLRPTRHTPTTVYPSMQLRWGGPSWAAAGWQLAQMHSLAPGPPLLLGWGLSVLLSLCCCFALLRRIFSRLLSLPCDFVRSCPCHVAAAPAATALAATRSGGRGLDSPTGFAYPPWPPPPLLCPVASMLAANYSPHTLGKNVNSRGQRINGPVQAQSGGNKRCECQRAGKHN